MSSVSSAPRKNDIQEFPVSGTWTKPPRARADDLVLVEIWAAGGGGARDASGINEPGGGGGGGYVYASFKVSDLGATESVTIGAGGAGRTSTDGNGLDGGNSSFGSHLTVEGGKKGLYNSGGGGAAGNLLAGAGKNANVSCEPCVYGGGGGSGRIGYSEGISTHGGNGGQSTGAGVAPNAVDAAGGAQTPGGGGAGGYGANGGDGADGFARVTVINGG